MRRASGSDMQLTVTGKQLGVGEALRSHVEASLEALLIKYFGSAIEAHAVIAEMSTDLPRLTVGEAVMRMDLADAPVLLFRNRAHGELNLVYRRSDGNIGWIDPALEAGRSASRKAGRANR